MTDRERTRSGLAWSLATAAIFSGTAWAIGVSIVQSVLIAAAICAIGACISLAPTGQTLAWPERNRAGNDGTRREVSRLSWAMIGRDDRVSEASLRRLQQVALRRLAMRGIDGTDPDQQAAAQSALGTFCYQHLFAPTGGPPRYDQFVRCVTELEKLDHGTPR